MRRRDRPSLPNDETADPKIPAMTEPTDPLMEAVNELHDGLNRLGEARASKRNEDAEKIRPRLAELWGEFQEEIAALGVPLFWTAQGRQFRRVRIVDSFHPKGEVSMKRGQLHESIVSVFGVSS